jgi:hypothetical protein
MLKFHFLSHGAPTAGFPVSWLRLGASGRGTESHHFQLLDIGLAFPLCPFPSRYLLAVQLASNQTIPE